MTDPGAPPSDKYIWLRIGTVTDSQGDFLDKDESYDVTINGDTQTVDVTGQDPAGVFYGVQTLLSLVGADGRTPTGSCRRLS